MIREVVLYGEGFIDFYDGQNEKVQTKINYVLDLIRYERHVPSKFLKLLVNTSGIYEVRVITHEKNIRVLCFFDSVDMIVLVSCFLKKSQKTPAKEIRKAERLKQEYFEEKNGNNEED